MESRVFGFFIALFLVFSTSTLICFGAADCYKSVSIHKECDNGWFAFKFERATEYCNSECTKRGHKWGNCNDFGKFFSGGGVCYCHYPC